MTIDAEVRAIREAADQKAIAKLLAGYPAGREIGPREPGTVSYAQTLLAKLPRDPAKRRAKLEQQLTSHRETLRKDIEHYDRIRRDGLDAISSTDLVVAYSGDALSACRCSLDLKAAHVSFNRSMVDALEHALKAMDAEEVAPRPGLLSVSAQLAPQKAFIVKKWAAAAKAAYEARTEDDLRLVHVRTDLPPHQAFIVRKWAVDTPAPVRSAAEAIRPAQYEPFTVEPGMLYEVHREGARAHMENGNIVIVTKVSDDGQAAWAHDNKPVKYRTNRNKRRVVDHDPACILTIYTVDALRPAPEGTTREYVSPRFGPY